MLAQGGRPLPARSRRLTGRYAWQARPDQERIAWRTQQGACVVIGTHRDASHVSDLQVLQADTAHRQVASGGRCLKDPVFFVASLLVQQPCRIPGLRMVLTLALLVEAVTQRRLRGPGVRHHDTIPKQINQPTEQPTGRWVFQRLDGIHRVRVTGQDQAHDLIEGLNEGQIRVLRVLGKEVCQRYQMAPG